LLSEAQPKNALVTPPQIRKQMKTFNRVRARKFLQFYSAIVLNFIFLKIFNFQASLSHRANACPCLKKGWALFGS
jgi:hypothetical protein